MHRSDVLVTDECTSLWCSGPSFQIHGGGGLSIYQGRHPELNLQADSTGCAVGNSSCPRWTIGVSAGQPANPSCSEGFDACWTLGPVELGGSSDAWNNWVVQWRGSPSPTHGYLAVWRNGKVVLPKTSVATSYNDTAHPYIKFGVYRGTWKGTTATPPTARNSAIAYAAIQVGNENSSYAEVSTAP